MGGTQKSKYPFYLKNNIKRLYVDVNRAPRSCPGYGCPSKAKDLAFHPESTDSRKAYEYFHEKAELMRGSLARKCTKGALLVDVHGQQRTQHFAQVGYGVRAEVIEKPVDLVKQLNSTGW